MAVRLMSLRGVPDDEHEQICALLDEHDIDYYETRPGNWLISAGALWLRDDSQFGEATQLLDGFQQQRYLAARQVYAEHPGSFLQRLIEKFLQNPLLFIVQLAIAIIILYFSVRPFFDIGQ